jgi:hypothetical protein
MVARGVCRALSARRALAGLAVLGASIVLSGCAGMATLRSEVASFGDWPAGQAAGTYAFERLPSQQARAQEQEVLETAARPALEAAGFKPAPVGTEPQVLVQLGARITRVDRSPWDDPLWWGGSFGAWRYGPWSGPSWHLGLRMDPPRVDREVAVLLRDRASGKPVYEARASNDGYSIGNAQLLAAMFAAALKDFPAVGLSPRVVVVPLPR